MQVETTETTRLLRAWAGGDHAVLELCCSSYCALAGVIVAPTALRARPA